MKKAVVLFWIVMLLALSLRLSGLTFESLWLDEGYQSMVDAYARPLPDVIKTPTQPFLVRFEHPGTVAEVLKNFRKVDPLCPPLYAILLNKWIGIFGGGDQAVRSFSVLLSAGCVAIVYWISYAFFGWRVALMTGLVESFSPFDVYYGQEVRMYALETLTASISSGALMYLLLKHPRARMKWLATGIYGVSAWAMINSHYTGLFVLAFQVAAAMFVVTASRNWRLLITVSAGWVLALLLWWPWIGLFKQAAAIRTATFYVARQPTWWWPITGLFFHIPANWIVFLTGKQVVSYAVPVFGTSVGLLIVALLSLRLVGSVSRVSGGVDFAKMTGKFLSWSNRITANRHDFLDGAAFNVHRRLTRNAILFIWCWAIVPAVGLWLIDVVENHRVIEISRYMIATAPAVYILAGLGAACLNWRKRCVQIFLLLHFGFAEANNIAHLTHVYQREPWRKMARAVEEFVPADELLLIAEYYDIACLDRYLRTPYRQVGVGISMGPQHLEKALSGASRFALITSQDGEEVARHMIPSSYKMLKKVDMEHGLHLRLYTRQP